VRCRRRSADYCARFTATCRGKPGLTLGATLDGCPDWADGARSSRAGFLVAGEVDGSVVVALMRGTAGPAGRVLGPSDVLHCLAEVAGLRSRRPVPRCG